MTLVWLLELEEREGRAEGETACIALSRYRSNIDLPRSLVAEHTATFALACAPDKIR